MTVRNANRTSSTSATSSKKLSPQLEGYRMLLAVVEKTKKKEGKLPAATLEVVDADLHKGPGGVRAVDVYFDSNATYELSPGSVRFDRAMVDEKKGVFFIQHVVHGNVGPFDLPKGVTLASLLDDGTPFPRPKNELQKAVGALAKVVEKGLPEAYARGRTQLKYDDGSFRSPTNEKLEHLYIDDHTGRIPGGGLMLGKDSFWIEMIPGYSGDCIGPFDLPKDFDATAIRKANAPEKPKKKSEDAFDSREPRGSVILGGGSDRWG